MPFYPSCCWSSRRSGRRRWVSANYTNNIPASIADGNPVGTTKQVNVSGVSGRVTNVQVQLNITAGFNGDLYA